MELKEQIAFLGSLGPVILSILDKGLDGTTGKYELSQLQELLKEHCKSEYDNEHPSQSSHTPWSPDYKNLRACFTVEDVQALIKEARQKGSFIRCAGAQHSVPKAVFERGTPDNIHVKLTGDLRKITVLEEAPDKSYLIVRVGAGCNLGIDPSDEQSTEENSLTHTADKLGYALPILGGMSHQTLGGFMQTSTAGGTIDYGFSDSLIGIEMVDGLGRVQTFEQGTDDFNAAAVAMGLFGIVTHVTLKLIPKYLVKGGEQVVATVDSILASAETFQGTLKANNYVHSVWFAQAGVDNVLQFIANQAPASGTVVPYVHPLESEEKTILAALALAAVNLLYYSGKEWAIKLGDTIVAAMNPRDESPREFNDHWWRALPNDDLANIDEIIRVQFTEIWVDLSRAQEVLEALKKLFQSDPIAAGNFGVEVYAAKASPFWMSQSYGREVIRIDPYWWEYNPRGNLGDYFMKFWNVLLAIPTARLHWGKHFPEVGTQFGDITIGPEYVEKSFPRFKDWLAKREEYDPDQIFMSSYWRALLGISA